jgi:hypothetical protein
MLYEALESVRVQGKSGFYAASLCPMSELARQPLSPSVNLVNEYLRKWETLEKYTLQEASLALLFRELCPRNDMISHVLLKVSALNDFYSTNIFDTHSVAKHILAIGVKDRIVAGDANVVNELALVSVGGKQRNFYSFASKYCNHHNAEAFPIYDSYVEKMLRHFQRIDRFAKFQRKELKLYGRFVEIISSFRKHYALEQFSLRQIDVYLWLAGKDAFLRFKNRA